jgi:hypothetical protein
MNKQQWDGVPPLGPFMHVMNIECPEPIYVDISSVLRELGVQFSLVLSPVISVLPPVDEALNVSEWGTIGPASVFEFGREGSKGKLFVKKG